MNEVYEKYTLDSIKPEIDFMVDDCSENKAKVDAFIDSANVDKVVAQKDTIFSNSMIEALPLINSSFFFVSKLIIPIKS